MTYRNYEVLNDIFANHFQKQIEVRIGDDVIYDGKLCLFKRRNYTFQVTLIKNGARHETEVLPIPFLITVLDDDNIELDYTIDTLTNDKTAINIIKRLKKPQKSVFYDKKATIKFI